MIPFQYEGDQTPRRKETGKIARQKASFLQKKSAIDSFSTTMTRVINQQLVFDKIKICERAAILSLM